MTTSIAMLRHIVQISAAVCCVGASLAIACDPKCSAPKTRMEELICTFPALSSLDDQLSEAYQAARKNAPDRTMLALEQQQWEEIRDHACAPSSAIPTTAVVDCLNELYEDRIQSLNFEATRPLGERLRAWHAESRVSMAKPGKGAYAIRHDSDGLRTYGAGTTICESMLRWINRHANRMVCPTDVVISMPGLGDLEWHSLDPHTYEELLVKSYSLVALDSELRRKQTNVPAWAVYFGDERYDGWPSHLIVERSREAVSRDIKRGLKMSVLRGNFVNLWDNKDETVVRLEMPTSRCTTDSSKRGLDGFVFATDDLTEISKDIESQRAFVAGGRLLKRFKGTPYFINASPNLTGVAVERDYGIPFCEIVRNGKQGEIR